MKDEPDAVNHAWDLMEKTGFCRLATTVSSSRPGMGENAKARM